MTSLEFVILGAVLNVLRRFNVLEGGLEQFGENDVNTMVIYYRLFLN